MKIAFNKDYQTHHAVGVGKEGVRFRAYTVAEFVSLLTKQGLTPEQARRVESPSTEPSDILLDLGSVALKDELISLLNKALGNQS